MDINKCPLQSFKTQKLEDSDCLQLHRGQRSLSSRYPFGRCAIDIIVEAEQGSRSRCRPEGGKGRESPANGP